MIVDRALVEHVAQLASLKLSPDELAAYELQLSCIIGYIDQLGMLSDVANEAALDLSTPERADCIAASLPVEETMAQAPQKTGTAFQVPRIIE